MEFKLIRLDKEMKNLDKLGYRYLFFIFFGMPVFGLLTWVGFPVIFGVPLLFVGKYRDAARNSTEPPAAATCCRLNWGSKEVLLGPIALRHIYLRLMVIFVTPVPAWKATLLTDGLPRFRILMLGLLENPPPS